MKLFSVMLAFCMLPVTLTQAQSLKQLLKEAKKAKKELKNRQEEVQETNHAEPVAITNANDEIALVVSAEGVTKEEAVKIALRSAIEQSYGTFVSANTTLLDDEMVKDEIVTVTTGSIKEYQELADVALPNGNRSVTLKAVVCISKLVSYAQSKGAETEFAGAAFAMNMKMKELNKKNELAALYNLYQQLKVLAPIAVDKKLTIQEPKVTSNEEVGRLVLPWINWNRTYEVKKGKYVWPAGFDKRHQYNALYDNFFLTFDELFSIYYNDSADSIIYEPQRGEALRGWIESADNSYLMDMNIELLPNKNTKIFFDLIESTINSLVLSKTELEEYERQNIEHNEVYISFDRDSCRGWLRTSIEDLKKWSKELYNLFCAIFSDFKIVDNTGTESYFNAFDYLMSRNIMEADSEGDMYLPCIGTNGDIFPLGNILMGDGLFEFVKVQFPSSTMPGLSFGYHKISIGASRLKWPTIKFLIPKDEIMKYSNFRIENRW